ncbi:MULTISPECIES: AAA family ATPase [Ralstonia]|jgi:energy-coupling factor transporter ATP-binding protein EcfA2|uniref:AAA family ATPase n=3 Tax=Pseudomonadota TaxID=1224 RepID=A0A848P469_9RALS|nr:MULTISPECIES: AAA family ATPase [Ralstonia]MBA4201546.1 ATPase [Ralstonia sp.]MBA4232196.1 ATPase [Ralstonia sp.]MBA4236295.1 ATPase [Ralstonia sp.]MBA4403241.1 ATPase [Ralstonia sp.]NMV40115.1 AAA family ATPase [Ralstonia insidiosa]
MLQQNSSALSPVHASASALLDKRIKHTRVMEVMAELDTLIYPGSQDSILLVCGPTGAGKTTLAKHMVHDKLDRTRAQMESNAGVVPAIYVEAPASGEHDFSWRLFYQRILAQLGDDLDSPKVAYGVDAQSGRMTRPRGASGNSLAALRTAVERGLRERQVQFVVIDEAAHIIRQTRSNNKLEIQLDTLKSLVNQCGTQMVMVGSYDLYQLVSLSGQLARRTHVLHFERYRSDRGEDVRSFEACVRSFENALPRLWGGQLTGYTKELQDNTLGCVGTLSSVLTRAARLAEAGGAWSVDALKRALLNEAQRKRILEEIVDGEAAIGPSLTRVMSKPQRSGAGHNRSAA